MFGLFKSPPFEDPQLGTLTRSGGRWKGTISFGPHANVELRLAGGGKAPDAAALALARELPARLDELREPIESELFEHFEPYRDAAESGDPQWSMASSPRIERASDVWAHVTAESVRVEPLPGSPARGPVVEIAYRVAWDEEHTLGARIQEWRLFELCGSI